MKKILIFLFVPLVLMLFFQNCSGSGSQPAQDVQPSSVSKMIGRSFELGEAELSDGSEKRFPQVVTIRFVSRDQVSGKLQCNSYKSDVNTNYEDRLEFLEMRITLGGCGLDEEDRFEFDSEYRLDLGEYSLTLESLRNGSKLYFYEQFQM